MEIQAVIDRFEGSKAIVFLGEEEVQVVWPRHILPKEVKEGDILQVTLQIDHGATAAAKAEAENLLEQVLGKNQES